MSAFCWCSHLRSHFLSPLTFSLAHNDCALSSLLTNPHSLVALCWHFQPSTKISRVCRAVRLHVYKGTVTNKSTGDSTSKMQNDLDGGWLMFSPIVLLPYVAAYLAERQWFQFRTLLSRRRHFSWFWMLFWGSNVSPAIQSSSPVAQSSDYR